jgi:hypothetical protein
VTSYDLYRAFWKDNNQNGMHHPLLPNHRTSGIQHPYFEWLEEKIIKKREMKNKPKKENKTHKRKEHIHDLDGM